MHTQSKFLIALFALTSSPSLAASEPPGDWRMYSKAGNEAFAVGDFSTAEVQFRSALDLATKTAVPSLQVKYANSLMCQGKFKQAAKEVKKTLALAKSVSGVQSVDYGEALDLQGWSLQADGKNDAAISSLQNSIAVLEQVAPGSSDLADAYQHLGLLDETEGLLDPALGFYNKALKIRETMAGINSLEAADMREAIGRVEFRKGAAGDAAKLFANALRIKESLGEPWKVYAPEPTQHVVTFRFIPGSPNCERGFANGVQIERITANGITVEAGISQKPSEFAKTTRALVRIQNHSLYDIDVLPQPATFIQVTPSIAILKPINVQQLAEKIEKKGESKARWIKFWGADATSTVTSYAQMNGAAPVYSYVPTSFGWSTVSSNYRNGNTTMFSTRQVPDYQKRAEAYQKAQEATNASRADADAVRDTALGPNKLAANGNIQGALDFEFSKYKSAILRLPIGNSVFEFRFE